VLTYRVVNEPAPGSTTFSLARRTLIGLVTRSIDLGLAVADGSVRVDGDASVLGRLVSVLAPLDRGFAIVTP
jgi:alkyl sulfatase BDS1-like metallo-beta-lactamase superfamily hydrolase